MPEKTTMKISSNPVSGRRTGTASQRKQAIEAERRLREQLEAKSKQRIQASGSKRLSTPPPTPRKDRSSGRLSKASRQGGTPMKEDQADLVDGDQKPSAVMDAPPNEDRAEKINLPATNIDTDNMAAATDSKAGTTATEGATDAEKAPPSAPSTGATTEDNGSSAVPPKTPKDASGEAAATKTPGVKLKSVMSQHGRSRSVEARPRRRLILNKGPPCKVSNNIALPLLQSLDI